MLKTHWELDGNIVERLWCLLFFPPKHLPFYQTSYWQDLLLDFTYLLTYLLTGNCLPYYRQLNPTWRLRKLNGLFYLPRSHAKLSLVVHYLPRSHGKLSLVVHYLPRSLENFSRNLEKLSLDFITCHVVSRTFSLHFTTCHVVSKNFSLHFITCHAVELPPGPQVADSLFLFLAKLQNSKLNWVLELFNRQK